MKNKQAKKAKQGLLKITFFKSADNLTEIFGLQMRHFMN